MVVLPKSCADIGESLSTAHMKQKADSRRVFPKIVQNIKFLGRQGIVLCGHVEAESNFMQLFKLCALDNPKLENLAEANRGQIFEPQDTEKILDTMTVE